jgi:hypothetical protein
MYVGRLRGHQVPRWRRQGRPEQRQHPLLPQAARLLPLYRLQDRDIPYPFQDRRRCVLYPRPDWCGEGHDQEVRGETGRHGGQARVRH